MTVDQLNKIIHERLRLGIVSALAARHRLTFTELKELLEVTDGNLSVHISVLERNGLVRVDKDFADRKPRTTVTLTTKGRREFEQYVDEIERLLRPEE